MGAMNRTRRTSMIRSSLRRRFGSVAAVALICAWMMFASAGIAQAQTAASANRAEAAPAMRLDAGDLLEITTFDTPELSGKFRVDSRGDVSLPIGGAVRVLGLTAEQTAVAGERFLRDRDILKNPHVTVLVLEYATQGVNVMGEVKQPGIYPLSGKHGVLDFISIAGGRSPYASQSVSITQNTPPWDVVTVNLAGPRGDSLENDVEVQPGDRIVVLRAGVVYVI